MKLVLRALGTAATGFWRFLIVLPFVLLLALVLNMSFSIALPWFLDWLVYPTMSVFVFLVAIRTALAQLGEYGAPVLGRLLMSGLIYTVIQIVLLYYVAYDLSMVLGLLSVMGVEVSGFVFFLIVNLFLLPVVVLHAALLVPMAAAAHAGSEGRNGVDPIWGFGSFFLPLFLIVLGLTYVNRELALGQNLMAGIGMLVSNFFTYLEGEKVEWPGIERLVEMGLSSLLWSILVYFAASLAAHAFLATRERRESTRVAELKVTPAERVDARSLRKARDTRT